MQYDLPPSLPKPDATSAAHSERVSAFIRERICDAGGDISFAEYMQHALYAPGLGYYSAGATKFGEQGDFITAPEASSVFGHIVARQCADVLTQINSGDILIFSRAWLNSMPCHPPIESSRCPPIFVSGRNNTFVKTHLTLRNL
jgi:hypothetical protein